MTTTLTAALDLIEKIRPALTHAEATEIAQTLFDAGLLREDAQEQTGKMSEFERLHHCDSTFVAHDGDGEEVSCVLPVNLGSQDHPGDHWNGEDERWG